MNPKSGVIATGNTSVSIGGDAAGSVIISGSGNVINISPTNKIKRSDMKKMVIENLYAIINTRFNSHDIVRIASELGMDYDDFKGWSKYEKIESMINTLQKQDRLYDLIDIIGQLRPDISLNDFLQTAGNSDN